VQTALPTLVGPPLALALEARRPPPALIHKPWDDNIIRTTLAVALFVGLPGRFWKARQFQNIRVTIPFTIVKVVVSHVMSLHTYCR
jgi:hypothetical protein